MPLTRPAGRRYKRTYSEQLRSARCRGGRLREARAGSAPGFLRRRVAGAASARRRCRPSSPRQFNTDNTVLLLSKIHLRMNAECARPIGSSASCRKKSDRERLTATAMRRCCPRRLRSPRQILVSGTRVTGSISKGSSCSRSTRASPGGRARRAVGILVAGTRMTSGNHGVRCRAPTADTHHRKDLS